MATVPGQVNIEQGIPGTLPPQGAPAVGGQLKLEHVPHPGIYPQAYIIPNGHPTTDFVQQAQQVAAAQQAAVNASAGATTQVC